MLREGTIKEIDDEAEKESVRKIEAILFVSGKFLNMKDLISLSDLNPILIREVMEKLKADYQARDSSIQIVEKNEMWKMDVKQEYAKIVNRLASGSSEFSKAEQGTLAIIAFKQPVKQSVIIKIRGNKAYDHIKRFTELGLIKKKRMGHTYEISLSDEFYDYFNVSEQEITKKEPENEN
ncbi:SMC-Scp complex subunit ScpB [Candidatus Pacearchaeota archaeon]|nr:SMC-Scp complex subunit ScpB [Candidatus Pacearchaeota archaeon]